MIPLLKAAWGAARNTVLFGLWCAFGGALIAVTFQLGYTPTPTATPPTTPPSTTVASITPAEVRALTEALETLTTTTVPPEAQPLVDEAEAVLDDVRTGALPVEPPPTTTTEAPPSTTSTVPETTVLTWPTP